MSVDIKSVIERISLGRFFPAMKLTTVDHVTVNVSADGSVVPLERPAIGITMVVADSSVHSVDDVFGPVELFQCCPLPSEAFFTEEEAVSWIYSQVKAVMNHELAEFFRFDGKVFRPPTHPLKVDDV